MPIVNTVYSQFFSVNKIMLLALFSAGILSCSSSKKDFKKVSNVSASRVSAFPGAEGFGKFTVGGRYGKVLLVANLNDNGPGSFRSAAEAEFPRIIVFSVSGTIHLQNKIKIKGDVTIAGQSAPGTGICIADQSVLLGGDNIIVRFLRFRMGDKFQKGGMVDGNGGDDAFGGLKRKNIIIDHCSLSWSTDEVFSVYAGDSTSIQWNLIAEPLNYSYHFETGDSDYEHHGYGAIWGGVHASFHHNLFAHCNSRTPRFNGIRHTQEENCDFRNNVIYNWGGNNVYGGEGGHYNIVGNFYKAGPSTSKKSRSNLVTPFRRKDIPFGKWYVEGNLLEGNEMVSRKNQLGVKLNEPMPEDQLNNVLVNTAFDFMSGVTQDPQNAYNEVLSKSGCILPQRDTLDERIVGDVMNGKGKLIDVQGDYPHGTDYAQTVNAWPFLLQTSAMADTDEDGMPNDWEEKNGLNPKQNDAMLFQLDKQYTNVEVYLNSLVR